MADFTDKRINQTYQRIVQVDNSVLQDGKGNTLSGSMGNLTVSGTLAVTGHSNISASLSRLDYFSASLDNTYATDAELSSVSSSLAAETAQLLNFSASLDATYATDSQLESVSSSLASETAQLLDFSASLDATFATDAQLSAGVAPLTAATASYALKSAISGAFDTTSASLASRIAGLDADYATDVQLNALSSSVSANYLYLPDWQFASASIKADISFDSGRIGALEAKRLVSSSRQITGALDTIYPRKTEISGSSDSRFATINAATSSYAIKTEVTGSFDILSASFESRITTVVNDTNFDSSRIAALEAKRLVSSSRQITGALDVIYPRKTEISGSSDSRFAVLNAATSSYAAKSEITGSFAIESSRIDTLETVVSASVLLNLTPVDPLPTINVNTGSFAVTGSTLAYYDGNNWKVVATGSTLPL